LVLPAGTLMSIRVNQPLSTDRNQPGDGFSAILQQPLVAGGYIIAARGQSVLGRVTESVRAGYNHGTSKLGVELGELTLVDGQQMPIHTELVEQRGGTSRGRDAAAIAGTTGLGAAIGASVNGGVGAAVGAGIGAVVSSIGVMSTRGKDTMIYPETILTFRTREAVTINTSRSAAAFQPVAPQDYQNANNYSYRPDQPYGSGYRPTTVVVDGPGYSGVYGYYPGYGYGYGWFVGPRFNFSFGHGYYGHRRW